MSEPSGTPSSPSKTAPVLRISAASPTGVPVAWHSSRETPVGAEPGLFVGGPDRALLPFLGRGEEALAAAVVREADAADDAVDRVAVPPRVREALQDDEGGALRGNETVGLAGERGASGRCG